MTTTPEQDALILAWNSSCKELGHAKAKELELRTAVIKMAFPAGIREGVNNFELGNGYVLKAEGRLNYKLDNRDNARAVVDCAAKLPEHVAAGLFKWEADIKTGVYKKLDPTHKSIVDAVLTITPGTPGLELVEPKAVPQPEPVTMLPAGVAPVPSNASGWQ